MLDVKIWVIYQPQILGTKIMALVTKNVQWYFFDHFPGEIPQKSPEPLKNTQPGYVKIAIMAIEIMDLPIENCGSFHSYVAVYQRVPISHLMKY